MAARGVPDEIHGSSWLYVNDVCTKGKHIIQELNRMTSQYQKANLLP